MTANEFNKWQSEMKLKRTEIATLFEVTPNTIGNWKNGFSPIPKAVEMACKFLWIKERMCK
jgi:DNA-binding transcriptional regulator YiaG